MKKYLLSLVFCFCFGGICFAVEKESMHCQVVHSEEKSIISKCVMGGDICYRTTFRYINMQGVQYTTSISCIKS